MQNEKNPRVVWVFIRCVCNKSDNRDSIILLAESRCLMSRSREKEKLCGRRSTIGVYKSPALGDGNIIYICFISRRVRGILRIGTGGGFKAHPRTEALLHISVDSAGAAMSCSIDARYSRDYSQRALCST